MNLPVNLAEIEIDGSDSTDLQPQSEESGNSLEPPPVVLSLPPVASRQKPNWAIGVGLVFACAFSAIAVAISLARPGSDISPRQVDASESITATAPKPTESNDAKETEPAKQNLVSENKEPDGLTEIRHWLRHNLHSPTWHEIEYYPPVKATEYHKFRVKTVLPDHQASEPVGEICQLTIKSPRRSGEYSKSELFFTVSRQEGGGLDVDPILAANSELKKHQYPEPIQNAMMIAIWKDLLSVSPVDLGAVEHR